MSEPLPVEIDPLTLAERGRELRGAIPVDAFHRLAGWLAATEGELTFELRFGRDEQGRWHVQGHLAGSVALECQRCLGQFALPLDRAFELVLVESEAEAETLPEEVEAVVVGSRRSVHTVDLLEDELILALPLVPRCEAVRRCAPAVELLDSEEVLEDDPTPRQQPFAGLGDSINKKSNKQ